MYSREFMFREPEWSPDVLSDAYPTLTPSLPAPLPQTLAVAPNATAVHTPTKSDPLSTTNLQDTSRATATTTTTTTTTTAGATTTTTTRPHTTAAAASPSRIFQDGAMPVFRFPRSSRPAPTTTSRQSDQSSDEVYSFDATSQSPASPPPPAAVPTPLPDALPAPIAQSRQLSSSYANEEFTSSRRAKEENQPETEDDPAEESIGREYEYEFGDEMDAAAAEDDPTAALDTQLLALCPPDANITRDILPASLVPRLIAQKVLHNLCDKFGVRASLRIDPAAPLRALLVVRGRRDARSALLDELNKWRLDEWLTVEGSCYINLPQSCVSALIGKGGRTIRRIKHESGCYVRVQESGSRDAAITIRGTGSERQKCRVLLHQHIVDILSREGGGVSLESHLVLSRPFPEQGAVELVPMPEHSSVGRNMAVLDVVQSAGDDKEEHSVDMFAKLSKSELFNCISLHMAQSHLRFNLRSQTSLLALAVSRVSRLLSLVAAGQYTVVNVEMSVGKQAFQLNGEYPPTQFQIPDACSRTNSRVLAEFFESTRFYEKMSDGCAAKFADLLEARGYRRLAVGESGDPARAAKNDREHYSVKTYWKHMETKMRHMTKVHVDKETGECKTVQYRGRRAKPIIIGLLHPSTMADVRLRLTLVQELKGTDVPASVRSLCSSLNLQFESEPAFNVTIDYPSHFNTVHTLLRVEDKQMFELDGIRATLAEVFQTRKPVPSDQQQLHNRLDFPGPPPDEPERSFELSVKSLRLRSMLRNYVDDIVRLGGGDGSDSASVASSSANSNRSGMSTAQSVREVDFKAELAVELSRLMAQSEAICRSVKWESAAKADLVSAESLSTTSTSTTAKITATTTTTTVTTSETMAAATTLQEVDGDAAAVG